MPGNMEFQSRLSREEFQKASLEYYYKTSGRVILFISLIILFSALINVFYMLQAGISLISQNPMQNLALIIIIILFAVFFFFIPNSVKHNAGKQYDSSPKIKNKFLFTLTDSGINIKNLDSADYSTFEWKDIYRYTETKSFVMIFISNISAYIISREIIARQNIDNIYSYLQEKLPGKKNYKMQSKSRFFLIFLIILSISILFFFLLIAVKK